MSRRLSYNEKGKGLQRPNSPPRLGRVKLPDYDASDLMRKHELTLIGRTTNQRAQRMWSLISFLADHWKCKSRPFGSDLGQGKFQFQFDNSEDLQAVLENRPYHFGKWMVILQKWEPNISPEFPSQITFWIQVQGVPVHLWNEAILRGIGDDIGSFDCWEITPSKARFRALVNGLRPLMFESILEFANGDEVVAYLLYEKLEKHCTICCMLDHEKEECPQRISLRNSANSQRNNAPPPRKDSSYAKKQLPNKPYPKLVEPQHSSGFMGDARRTGHSQHRPSPREHHFETSQFEENRRAQRFTSRQRQEPSLSHSQNSRQLSTHRSGEGRWVDTGRRIPQPAYSHHKDHLTDSYKGRWEVPETRASTLQIADQRGEGVATSSARPPRSSGPTPPMEQTVEFNEALIEAREELREVMIQYSSCADSTESAARKERMRLAEEKGEAEEVARNMVAATKALNAQILNTSALNANDAIMGESSHVNEDNNPIRTPALARLGPPADPNNEALILSTERVPVKKRLGRPPLGKEPPKAAGSKIRSRNKENKKSSSTYLS